MVVLVVPLPRSGREKRLFGQVFSRRKSQDERRKSETPLPPPVLSYRVHCAVHTVPLATVAQSVLYVNILELDLGPI